MFMANSATNVVIAHRNPGGATACAAVISSSSMKGCAPDPFRKIRFHFCKRAMLRHAEGKRPVASGPRVRPNTYYGGN